MKKIMLILLSLFATSILPTAASADCMLVEYFDHFIVQEDSTVILYNGSVALVKIDLECSVQPESKIRLLKNYLCNGDNILIDDSSCMMVSVTSPSDY
ncbi:MAG: hypothetical protein ACXWL9_09925 [Syntrophales bacterium]